jgi:serine/threonine protein kinase
MHRAGYGNYDVKLENILVANDYSIKICDVGLSEPLNYVIKYPRGSPGYIAPEQFENKNFSGP